MIKIKQGNIESLEIGKMPKKFVSICGKMERIFHFISWLKSMKSDFKKLILEWSMMSYKRFKMERKLFYEVNYTFYILYPISVQKLSSMTKN